VYSSTSCPEYNLKESIQNIMFYISPVDLLHEMNNGFVGFDSSVKETFRHLL
jgi:hypothetical protein